MPLELARMLLVKRWIERRGKHRWARQGLARAGARDLRGARPRLWAEAAGAELDRVGLYRKLWGPLPTELAATLRADL